MKPSCSGMAPCVVDIPARTQVEPRLLEHRTLTKSRGPTMFPGVAAAFSWVITVSFPIFSRICSLDLKLTFQVFSAGTAFGYPSVQIQGLTKLGVYSVNNPKELLGPQVQNCFQF